jgi:hypothetical protein
VEKILEWVMSAAGFVFAVLDRNSWWLGPFLITVAGIALLYAAAVLLRWGVEKSIWLYMRAKLEVVRAYKGFWNTIDWIGIKFSLMAGTIMAKIRKHVVADIVFDALFKACMDGEMTNAEFKRFNNLIGKWAGLDDLVTKKRHKNAIKNALKKNKLDGPKQKIPGGAPSLHIPPVEEPSTPSNVVPRSKFLQRQKEKNAA